MKRIIFFACAFDVFFWKGLLYALLFEKYSVHTWFIVMPCVTAFALFIVMLWGRQGAKEILE